MTIVLLVTPSLTMRQSAPETDGRLQPWQLVAAWAATRLRLAYILICVVPARKIPIAASWLVGLAGWVAGLDKSVTWMPGQVYPAAVFPT